MLLLLIFLLLGILNNQSKSMKTLLFIYLQLLLLLLIIIGRVVKVEYLHLVVEVEPSTITELCLSDGIDGYLGSFYLNTTFAELMLKEHNNKRKLHQSCPLKWSSELFNYASQFAVEYSCSGILQHSGGKYGENLAFGYLPIGAIEAWYDEGKCMFTVQKMCITISRQLCGTTLILLVVLTNLVILLLI